MNAFTQMLQNPIKFKLFLVRNLPSAYFSGVRLREISAEKAIVSVPYKWFSRNPFRSTYFACLAMAAEMSTGVLVLAQVYQRRPSVSMLITNMTAEYHKKATDLTLFTCNEGLDIKAAVEDVIANNGSTTITVKSTGVNASGEPVATFSFTWSLKVRVKS